MPTGTGGSLGSCLCPAGALQLQASPCLQASPPRGQAASDLYSVGPDRPKAAGAGAGAEGLGPGCRGWRGGKASGGGLPRALRRLQRPHKAAAGPSEKPKQQIVLLCSPPTSPPRTCRCFGAVNNELFFLLRGGLRPFSTLSEAVCAGAGFTRAKPAEGTAPEASHFLSC